MLRVGLTGGIGSGKSTVAAMFGEMGCFVSQSDEVARGMMQPGQQVYCHIVQTFGQGIVQPDGSLDRKTLARLAFAEGRVEELNDLIHPAVIQWQTEWLRSIGEQHPDGIGIIESALIFETRHGGATTEQGSAATSPLPLATTPAPWRQRFDRTILVTAAERIRIQRCVDRYIAREDASSLSARSNAEADARARIRAQMPDAQKEALADVTIWNEGSLEELRARVTEVWHELRGEARVSSR